MPQREVGEKTLKLLLARKERRHLAQRNDLRTQPMQISLLRGDGLVLATDDSASAFKRFRGIHPKDLSSSFFAFNVIRR